MNLMRMALDQGTPVSLAQLGIDRPQEPFRVIEMAMRKDDGLDSTELQAHPASVPFDGIGIGARVEKDCPLLSVCASGNQKREAVVGRTQAFSGKFPHPRSYENAQF